VLYNLHPIPSTYNAAPSEALQLSKAQLSICVLLPIIIVTILFYKTEYGKYLKEVILNIIKKAGKKK